MVNSTKSMTGHLLGGAGAGVGLTALAVLTSFAADDQHLRAGSGGDLDYCANVAREMKIDVALKNNFGFGGTNGTLVFRRV